jgi:group I intron endonuclease
MFLKRSVLRGKSIINNSLLKYGYCNFSLDILEYCESSILIKREQYYIDTLNPEYNILKIAGSSFGYKHKKKLY